MDTPRNTIIKRVFIIALFVFLIMLLGAAGMGGWLVYLYHHPQSLKPRLEKTMTRLTGISMHIHELNYSLNPIFIRFNGISIKKSDEFDLKIGTLKIEMERTVSRKRKILTIRRVDLEDFSGIISRIPSLPGISFKQKKLSFFWILLDKIKERYLFQDLKFGFLKARDGLLDIRTNRAEISLDRITAAVDAEGHAEMTFGLRVEYGKDLISASEARISSDISMSGQAGRIPLTLSTAGLGYHGPYAAAEEISLQASLEYDRKKKIISLASSHMLAPRILIYPGTSEEAFTPRLEIKAAGMIDLGDKQIENTHIDITLGPSMSLETIFNGSFGKNPGLNLEFIQAVISPEQFRPFLPPALKKKLDPFHWEGNTLLTGKATFSGRKMTQTPEGHLKVDLKKNRFAYQYQDTKFEGVMDGTLYIDGRWPEPEIRADIETTGVEFADPRLKIAAEKLDLELAGKHPLYEIGNLSGKIKTLNVRAGPGNYVFGDIRFKSEEGKIDLVKNHFHLSIPEMSSPQVKNLALDLTLNQGKKEPAKFLDLASWRIDLKGALTEFNLDYPNDFISAEGSISGDIQFEGQWPRYKAGAAFRSQDARCLGPWGSLSPRNLRLALEIDHPQYHLRNLSGVIAQAVVNLGGKDFPVNDIAFQLPYSYMNLRGKAFDIPELTLNTQPLGTAHLSLNGRQNDFVVKLQSEDAHLLNAALFWDLLPRDWQLNAGETLECKASFKENLTCAYTAHFDLENLSLSNSDSTIMGEKLSLRTRLAGDLDIRNRKGDFHLNLLGQKGELLWNAFYFNLNSNPVSLNALVKADIFHNRLDVLQSEWMIKDIISLNLQGQFDHFLDAPDFQVNLFIPEIPVGPVFQTFVREPFQSKRLILKDLDVKGHITADLKLKGRKEINGIKGRIALHDMDLDLDDYGLHLERVNLALPLWYEKQALPQSGPALKGGLSLESMSIPWLPEQPLSFTLDVNRNQISIKDPTEIAIPGGVVRIGPIQGRHIYSHPAVETSLTLNNIDLEPWINRIRPLDIQGTLNGRLNPVLFTDNRVQSQGKLTARIASGEITLSDLHISQLNTPTPVFGLDGEFHRLNLAEITSNTPFGKIQGLLGGHINNLEIAYGQPQGFDLLLETVRERGIPQRISVEAVENITKLGGGQNPFMGGLTGIYMAFLKDFPYEKMGLHASLKNDVFRINGTIKEGGQEYIVKRGLYGVNIINRDPDNRIRFKEMVKRIKNLDLSKTKPVIQ